MPLLVIMGKHSRVLIILSFKKTWLLVVPWKNHLLVLNGCIIKRGIQKLLGSAIWWCSKSQLSNHSDIFLCIRIINYWSILNITPEVAVERPSCFPSLKLYIFSLFLEIFGNILNIFWDGFGTTKTLHKNLREMGLHHIVQNSGLWMPLTFIEYLCYGMKYLW